jgi:hypothetical protein
MGTTSAFSGQCWSSWLKILRQQISVNRKKINHGKRHWGPPARNQQNSRNAMTEAEPRIRRQTKGLMVGNPMEYLKTYWELICRTCSMSPFSQKRDAITAESWHDFQDRFSRTSARGSGWFFPIDENEKSPWTTEYKAHYRHYFAVNEYLGKRTCHSVHNLWVL